MSETVFNLGKTLEAFGNDEEILLSVSSAFISELPGEIKRLNQAISEEDFDTIRISSHTLKGQAGTFYAQRATDIAAQIEAAAKDNELDLVKENIDKFVERFEELQSAVSKMIEEKG